MHAPTAPNRYRREAEQTLDIFERSGIAVFPGASRRKGSYVEGWPSIAVDEAIEITRRDLAAKPINLAGRTGDGVAVLDLDAKEGTDPRQMLGVLRALLEPAIIAIVRTSRGFHIWIEIAEAVGNGFCSFIGGEIFSDPHLAMVPPSIHPHGHQYAWELEPREPDAPVNLKALGLVPDSARSSAASASKTPTVPVAAGDQDSFAELMAAAGVRRTNSRAQTLERCAWHDDRTPSLSVNWDAAVFYCFSEHCNVKGGIGRLRRLLGVRTPSYRQSGDAGGAGTARTSGDHLSGDKLGCQDTDAATERLALGLAELGSTHAQAVTECRSSFRVGKCTSCARTPAYPISCGHPLCVRCMPGRFAADWRRHASAMPEAMHILELRPHGLTPGSSGVLKQVRGRFRDWRARSGVTDGIYGARLDAAVGAVVLLAVPSDAPVPESTRAFDVEVVARDCSPDEVLRWLQSEYVDEAQSWRTGEELAFLLAETKGRRRFQGFGTGYGDGTPMDKKEEEPMADHGSEQEREERPLHKVSGGSGRGGHRTNSPACPYCDGKVELYPFTVPASEVQRVGAGWLWDGAGGSPAERRRRTP